MDGINLLRRAAFSSGAVSLKHCFLTGTAQYHAFHHLLHLRGGQGSNGSLLNNWVECDLLGQPAWLRRCSDNARCHPHAVVGYRGNHADQLQRGDADLLPHRDCADRDFRPAAQRLGQTSCLARQLNPGLLPKTVSANVFVKPLITETKRHLYRAHIA